MEDRTKVAFALELLRLKAVSPDQVLFLVKEANEKLAFGEQAMQKVLRTVKGMQVRPGALAHGHDLGFAAVTPTTQKITRDVISSQFGGEVPEFAGTVLNEMSSLARGGSKIVTPRRGDATTFFKSVPQAYAAELPKTPEHRRAFDALIKGHELAETQVKPSPAGMFYSHISPDVMLREHNMVATLPEHLKPAGEALRRIRRAQEGTDFFQATGINLGKGPRFSRHARKHLTKMMDNHRVNAANVVQDLTEKEDWKGLMKLPEQRAQAFAQLSKLGEITADDARRSLDRLDTLERNRPTLGQVGRYGALGAAGGGAIGAIGNAIEHGSPLKGATPKAKALNLVANTAKGALSGGAIPLARSALDRRAEVGTLRKFMGQDKTAAPWIHSRAEHILAKNPSMGKGEAFAIATQQAHATGHTPKSYGTAEGKATAKAKYDTPKDDEQRANPGGLNSPKLGSAALEIVKQAGLGELVRKVPQAVRALPGAAKNVALGAGERNMHLNEVAGLGVLAVPGIDTLQARLRARLAGDKSEHGAERRQLLGEGAHAALDVGGLGLLAAPAIGHLKHAYESFASVPYSAYGGKQAQNPPGMRGRSQIPAFVAPELAVKEGGAFRRVGELVTGSKASRLRDAAARGEGARRKELLSMARREESNVGKVQGALAAGAAIGAVKDTGELVAGAKDKLTKKEAAKVGPLKRVGELLTGSRANRLRDAAHRHLDTAVTKANSRGGELVQRAFETAERTGAPKAFSHARRLKGMDEKLLHSANRHTHAAVHLADHALNEGSKVNAARAVAAGTAVAAIPSRKKEAGMAQRLGELLSGSRARELSGKAKSLAGEASKLKHLAPTAPHGAGKYNKSTGRLLNQAVRYDKASGKVTALAGKERKSVGLARAGAGALAAGGALAASRKKEAGIGVGSSMTASQYSGPLSYGPFKMTSGIPAFTSPAMTKADPNAEPEAWAVGAGKTASMAATGAMSPAGKLTAAQRVGSPKTTGFAGPSIADIAKPKGFGNPIPGAQKNQL